ncbi:GNAT family N-acetyltransferase [Micromonospora echinospora]|uniref:GNAT family N-acetyltransferase n=1 Tax=Micromonospora echinospora TaxID=1877 RepID=UPI0034051B96
MMYEETIPGFGTLSLTPVDPAVHAGLLHGWVTQPRAVYWGMGSYTPDDVREIYEFIDGLTTHHAYLIRLDDVPVGLFQTYEPAADPVGERYEVRPGDIGMHLLLAPPTGTGRGLTTAVGPALARFLFRDPAHLRIVVEPDVRNELALRRLEREGFTFDDEIDMPDKRAQLAFLTRERFEADHPQPVAR